MEIEEVKKEIVKILKDELFNTEYAAFFFGSRITGTNSSTSDLDVGIEGKNFVPKNILRNIKSRCESISTLYSIDIVDFYFLNDDFKEVAKKKIERIV